jgi:hypothetical protein
MSRLRSGRLEQGTRLFVVCLTLAPAAGAAVTLAAAAPTTAASAPVLAAANASSAPATGPSAPSPALSDEAPQEQAPALEAAAPARRFKLGVELKANYRHSSDVRFDYPLPDGIHTQETVDPGSHAEVSMLALLADYDPAPLWHAHLRFNGVNLYYRNPTSTDHQYDLAELWLRFGRETGAAVVPERAGGYLKLGKFQRPERHLERPLESYGLVATAFNLFEDAGLEAGADLGRYFFAKAMVSQGNPLFVRDPDALAGDQADLLRVGSTSKLNSGNTILYDTHVEHLDFARPEIAGYVGARLGEPGGLYGLELMAWGRRRKLASSVDLPGSPLGGDLATFSPLGSPIVPFRGDRKQEVGANLWLDLRGVSLFAEYVNQTVAGLGRSGIEVEASWKIELPLALAAGGHQLFSYIAPAVRGSKLHNRFYNVDPTPEASLAWDWQKLDAGVKIGLWHEIDLTVEYSYNRIFLAPHFYVPSNETLGTLRIRL